MLDDFNLGDPGAFGGPHEPSGCVLASRLYLRCYDAVYRVF